LSNQQGRIYSFSASFVSLAPATLIETYEYDYLGNRTAKTSGGVRNEYTTDLSSGYSQVLKATIGSDSVYYTRGFELISRQEGSDVSYYIYDGGLSVRALTDESGTVTDTLVFDAFGNNTEKTGTTDNSYGFQGEEKDETGLYYLRARYMDPATGTFTSMDTYGGSLSDPMSLHKYMFANANPVKYSDPSGHFSMEELIANMGCQAIIAGALYEIEFSVMCIVDNMFGTNYSSNYSFEGMICQMAIASFLGATGYLISGLSFVQLIIAHFDKLPFAKRLGFYIIGISISLDLYLLSVIIRSEYGDNPLGELAADIIVGLGGNVGGSSVKGMIGILPGDVPEMVELAPGIGYDISDVIQDSDDKSNEIVKDSNGIPFTGTINGKQYYNGNALSEEFALGYGTNGKLIPGPTHREESNYYG